MENVSQTITLTDQAIERINKFKEKEAKPYFRIMVNSGGCSGFQYEFLFDDKKDGDEIVKFGNVEIVLDELTRSYLKGSVLDYVLTASDGRNIDFRITGIASQRNYFGLNYTGSTGISVLSTRSFSFVARGTYKLFSDDSFSVTGATAEFGVASGSFSESTDTALASYSLDTTEDAQESVFILDNVIRQLQTSRSTVGSTSIRLGITANELATRKENLTAAESAIRDTDVAAETAKLTAAQILQQAGVSVLARANAIPQIALTLLQG